MHGHDGTPVNPADVDLITAAPNLLAAAEWYVNARNAACLPDEAAAFRALEAAIAAARGEGERVE